MTLRDTSGAFGSAAMRFKAGTISVLPLPPIWLMVRSAWSMLARVAGTDAEHPLTVDLPTSLPLVQADPNRVQQVIANLLSNARKYTPANGRIWLAARKIDGAIEIRFDKKVLYYRSANPWQPDLERANRITALRRAELAQMQRYVAHRGCRRAIAHPRPTPGVSERIRD